MRKYLYRLQGKLGLIRQSAETQYVMSLKCRVDRNRGERFLSTFLVLTSPSHSLSPSKKNKFKLAWMIIIAICIRLDHYTQISLFMSRARKCLLETNLLLSKKTNGVKILCHTAAPALHIYSKPSADCWRLSDVCLRS